MQYILHTQCTRQGHVWQPLTTGNWNVIDQPPYSCMVSYILSVNTPWFPISTGCFRGGTAVANQGVGFVLALIWDAVGRLPLLGACHDILCLLIHRLSWHSHHDKPLCNTTSLCSWHNKVRRERSVSDMLYCLWGFASPCSLLQGHQHCIWHLRFDLSSANMAQLHRMLKLHSVRHTWHRRSATRAGTLILV